MQRRIVEIVACDNCTFELASVQEDMKGDRELIAVNDLQLRMDMLYLWWPWVACLPLARPAGAETAGGLFCV